MCACVYVCGLGKRKGELGGGRGERRKKKEERVGGGGEGREGLSESWGKDYRQKKEPGNYKEEII